uniref:Uncharacterized protein n=1 Tax=Caenorhabditis tropicalis TaxID=1561998 RepID=A0A1I7U8Q0_9PELO
MKIPLTQCNSRIDGFQARFPGLYQIYTETPERRRANVLESVNLALVMEKIKSLKKTSQKKEEGEEEKTPEEEDNEEPKSRERIIEEERDKEKATIVI